MKARVTITGNLTKDAENILNKNNQKQCIFSVAVNLTKDNGLYIDCFLNRHLSQEELKSFVKGFLCTFSGKYTESINIDMFGEKYLNKTLSITDFYASKIRSPFYKDFSIHLIGYIYDEPIVSDDKTVFIVSDHELKYVSADQHTSLYTCTLNYKLSDKVIDQLKENTPIYIQGLYDERITVAPVTHDIYMDRNIEIKDYEII